MPQGILGGRFKRHFSPFWFLKQAGTVVWMDPWGEPTQTAQRPQPTLVDPGAGGHPLLGQPVGADNKSDRVHQTLFREGSHPWLRDHMFEDRVILPVAVMIEMIRLASESIVGHELEAALTEVRIDTPLVVDASDGATVQTIVSLEPPQAGDAVPAKVRASNGSAWTRHLSAKVLPGRSSGLGSISQQRSTADGKDDDIETSGDEYYGSLADIGLSVGPTFQLIQSARRGTGRVKASITSSADPDGLQFDPAVLDACLHSLGLAVVGTGELQDAKREAYLPVSIARWSVFRPSRGHLTAYGEIRAGSPENPVGDLRLLDDQQRCIAELEGVRFARSSWASLGRRGTGGEESADLLAQLQRADFRDRSQILEDGLKSTVQQVLNLDASESVDVDCGLSDLGMDSVRAVELSVRLGTLLAMDLPSTLVFEHPTVSALAEHLRESLQSVVDFGTPEATDDTAGSSESDPTTALDSLDVADLTDALMDALDDAGY